MADTELNDEVEIVNDETPAGESGEVEQAADEKEATVEVSDSDLALLNLLKNPSTRRIAIDSLVAEAGIQVATGEVTKKEAQKNVNEMLKEALGPDWAFIAEKMGPVFQKAIADAKDEVRSEFKTVQERQILSETTAATEKLFIQYPDAKRLENEILIAMGKFQPDDKLSPFEYLESVYFMVKGRSGGKTLATEAAKRIQRNAKEVGNLASTSSADGLSSTVKGQRISLDDAVRGALQSTLKQHKK